MSERTETQGVRLKRIVAVVLATAGVVLLTHRAKASIETAVSVDLDEISRTWYGDSLGYQ